MKIVHENADFSGKTDFGNTFCENGNSIKWKFEQEFSTQTFKNGIPFYRESAVDCELIWDSASITFWIFGLELSEFDHADQLENPVLVVSSRIFVPCGLISR